jgi:acetolactate synthase-1/3 small subunit
VLAQVEKVELVKKVFTPGENTLYRELLLLKINAKGEDRERAMSVINVYRGRVVDLTSESMVIEVTGSPQKIGGFIDIMNEFDVVEICRTGATGIEVPGRTFDII